MASASFALSINSLLKLMPVQLHDLVAGLTLEGTRLPAFSDAG